MLNRNHSADILAIVKNRIVAVKAWYCYTGPNRMHQQVKIQFTKKFAFEEASVTSEMPRDRLF